MGKKFEVWLDYLEHDGGTKFYETVVISELVNDGRVPGNPSILVQRWGKIEANTGGGQIKVVKGDLRTCTSERQKILNNKGRLKPGKGQYLSKASPSYGIGRVIVTGPGSHTMMGEAELGVAMTEHYGTAAKDMIFKYFGAFGYDAEDQEINNETDDMHEHDRGTHWASW